jgi:hypothetical protein
LFQGDNARFQLRAAVREIITSLMRQRERIREAFDVAL